MNIASENDACGRLLTFTSLKIIPEERPLSPQKRNTNLYNNERPETGISGNSSVRSEL